MTYQLHHDDCLNALRAMKTASVDAIISDPPGAISFMNKKWDSNKGGRTQWIAWLSERLAEARRVLKPGHYAMIWALPRTSHYTGMACEDAGFILEEMTFHLFGSGFPKNKNKLKPAVECWWLVRNPGPAAALNIDACRVGTNGEQPRGSGNSLGYHGNGRGTGGNATPASGRWPAHLLLSHSPGCVPCGVKRVRGTPEGRTARLAGSELGQSSGWNKHQNRDTPPRPGYADADGTEQVDAWECQDGCAVAALDRMSGELTSGARSGKPGNTGWFLEEPRDVGHTWDADTGGASRFFTRLDPPEWECSEDCPIAALDEQSGQLTSHGGGNASFGGIFGNGKPVTDTTAMERFRGDTGGASRFFPNLDPPFFYAAKSSRRERSDGCDGLYWLADDTRPSGYRPITQAEYAAAQEAGERVARGNMHPCVKSLKLINWLCALISNPGDVVLDPFAGSGSIGVAALGLGRQFIGIESDEDYMNIAECRLAHAAARPQQLEIAI